MRISNWQFRISEQLRMNELWFTGDLYLRRNAGTYIVI